jgi:hypothetical protein
MDPTSVLGRIVSLLATGWLVFLVLPLSSTGLGYPFFAMALAVTVPLGVVALGLVLARRPFSRLLLVVWVLYPTAALSLYFLFAISQSPANPLFRVRFLLSRPALEDAARRALAQTPVAASAWVGLFPVERIDVEPSEVRFVSGGCGLVDECGLLFREGTIPAKRAKTRLKPLGGPWYHLYSVF